MCCSDALSALLVAMDCGLVHCMNVQEKGLTHLPSRTHIINLMQTLQVTPYAMSTLQACCMREVCRRGCYGEARMLFQLQLAVCCCHPSCILYLCAAHAHGAFSTIFGTTWPRCSYHSLTYLSVSTGDPSESEHRHSPYCCFCHCWSLS